MSPPEGRTNTPVHIAFAVRRPRAGPRARRSIAALSAEIRLNVDGGRAIVRTPNCPDLIFTVRDNWTGGCPAAGSGAGTRGTAAAVFRAGPAKRPPRSSAATVT